MTTYKEGHIGIMTTVDSKLNAFNGQQIKVIKVYSEPDDNHDQEVLPMYDVTLKNGSVLHIFHDEIEKL